MKKSILTAALATAVASGAMAQGIVTVGTSTSHPVAFSLTGSAPVANVPSGSPSMIPGFGQVNVAVFSTASGTSLTLDASLIPNFSINGWAQDPTLGHNSVPQAGDVSLGNTTLANGTAGSPVQFEIVGWTGTATTFAQAEQNALAGTALIGWAGSTLSGGALSWIQPTGTSGTPQVMLVGATAFNSLVLTTVPEPSTIALGGLAAASLLAFRRRK